MHIHVPLIPCLLIATAYFWQTSDIWGGWCFSKPTITLAGCSGCYPLPHF